MFPRIALSSIDYVLLCPGNNYFLCKPSQKVTNHGKILLDLDSAKAEMAHLDLWCGGHLRGHATGTRAGKWMQVARLSHRSSSLLINPCIASRDVEGGQEGGAWIYLIFKAEREELQKEEKTSFLWGRRTQCASKRNVSCLGLWSLLLAEFSGIEVWDPPVEVS